MCHSNDNENDSNVVGSRHLHLYDVTATSQYDESVGDDEITLDSGRCYA